MSTRAWRAASRMRCSGPTRVGWISPSLAAPTAASIDASSQGCTTAVSIAGRSRQASSSLWYFFWSVMVGLDERGRGGARADAGSRSACGRGALAGRDQLQRWRALGPQQRADALERLALRRGRAAGAHARIADDEVDHAQQALAVFGRGQQRQQGLDRAFARVAADDLLAPADVLPLLDRQRRQLVGVFAHQLGLQLEARQRQ